MCREHCNRGRQRPFLALRGGESVQRPGTVGSAGAGPAPGYNLTDTLWQAALELFTHSLTRDLLPLRLLGVGASRLTRNTHVQGDLFDGGLGKRGRPWIKPWTPSGASSERAPSGGAACWGKARMAGCEAPSAPVQELAYVHVGPHHDRVRQLPREAICMTAAPPGSTRATRRPPGGKGVGGGISLLQGAEERTRTSTSLTDTRS
jgi:hypothetical protein